MAVPEDPPCNDRSMPSSAASSCMGEYCAIICMRGRVSFSQFAKLMERCSDGVEDQGAEEAFMGPRGNCFRQLWKPSPVRAALPSALLSLSRDDSNDDGLCWNLLFRHHDGAVSHHRAREYTCRLRCHSAGSAGCSLSNSTGSPSARTGWMAHVNMGIMISSTWIQPVASVRSVRLQPGK